MNKPDNHFVLPAAQEAERVREAHSILKRVREETDPQIGAASRAIVAGAASHFLARDLDDADAVERLGARIGRCLGLVAFVVLAVLAAANFLSH